MKEDQTLVKYRSAQIFLLVSWIMVQSILLLRQGIFTGQESEKYIYEARHLLSEGSFSEKKYIFYAPTILLIAFCFKTGIGPAGVVILQLVLSGLSTICLYQLSWKLSKGSYRVAFITTALFIT